MPREPNGKQLLIVAVSVAAASVLPTCGVNDPALPNDGTGGAAGKRSAVAVQPGTTGGSTAGSGSVDVGVGGSLRLRRQLWGCGHGWLRRRWGVRGALSEGGAAGGVSGPMCGKVTLMINDTGHIASNLSDLLALINGPNATTDPYALAATGGGGHTHLITFNDAQVMTLRNGGSVTVMATATEAHSHSVTVTCTKK